MGLRGVRRVFPVNFSAAGLVLHLSANLRRGSIDGMIEFFEHTADLGLRVRAADLDGLFAEAARALFSAVVEDLGTVVASQRLEVRVAGTRPGISSCSTG